jgi:hypothetical protein
MDDHAGRLIDHDDRIVFVQNRERDILRGRSFARYFDLPNHHLISGAQAERRFGKRIVDMHVAGIDRPLQRGPAERGQVSGQKHIESLACVVGRD